MDGESFRGQDFASSPNSHERSTACGHRSAQRRPTTRPLSSSCSFSLLLWAGMSLISFATSYSRGAVAIMNNRQAFIAGPQFAFLGEDVHLVCLPSLSYNLSRVRGPVRWIHNDISSLFSNSSRYESVGDHSNELVIRSVHSLDAGDFRCIFYTEDMQPSTARHTLTVFNAFPADQEQPGRPRIVEITSSPTVLYEGDSAAFYCTSERGLHTRWFHSSLTNSAPHLIAPKALQFDSWLNFTRLVLSDSGSLQCQAANDYGLANQTSKIHVWPARSPTYPPRIKFFRSDLHVEVIPSQNESSHISHCIVVIKHGRKKLAKRKFRLSESRSSSSVKLFDVLGNQLGSFEGSTLHVRVFFWNKFGAGKRSTINISIPSRPIQPFLVTRRTLQGIELRWIFQSSACDLSGDRCFTVASYSIQYKDLNSSALQWKVMKHIPAKQCRGCPAYGAELLTNLTPGHVYELHVVSHTLAGVDFLPLHESFIEVHIPATDHSVTTSIHSSSRSIVTDAPTRPPPSDVHVMTLTYGNLHCNEPLNANMKPLLTSVQHAIEGKLEAMCACSVSMYVQEQPVYVTPDNCVSRSSRREHRRLDYEVLAASTYPCTFLQKVGESIKSKVDTYIHTQAGTIVLDRLCTGVFASTVASLDDKACSDRRIEHHEVTKVGRPYALFCMSTSDFIPVNTAPLETSGITSEIKISLSNATLPPERNIAEKPAPNSDSSSNAVPTWMWLAIILSSLSLFSVFIISFIVHKQWRLKNGSRSISSQAQSQSHEPESTSV